MHKKILCAILAFCLFISSLPVMTSASANADRDLHLVTSYCPDNYLDLRIKGEKLIVTGVLSTGFDSPFWAKMRVSSKNSFYTDEAEYVNITPGKTFSTEISLSSVTEPVSFVVYTNSERYGTYWDYIWHSIYIEPDGAGGYRFQTSPVLENNLEKESYWINPGRYLGSKSSQSNSADYLTGYLNNNLDEETSKKIQALSDEIVQGAKSEYEKVFLLYKWVVENIYYDYDAYYGTSSKNTSVSSILDNRRSVCAGYANMLQALIQAQGIPCIKVSTYSLGISTTGKWTDSYIATNSSNHAHNEAFVDGRWIAMDATWIPTIGMRMANMKKGMQIATSISTLRRKSLPVTIRLFPAPKPPKKILPAPGPRKKSFPLSVKVWCLQRCRVAIVKASLEKSFALSS